MRETIKCRDCQHFTSPEFPPQRAMGACGLEMEKMPPDAPACESYLETPAATFRRAREERDEDWERRAWRGGDA